MLVSQNVVSIGYFMPMCHGVNKNALPIVFPTPLPFTKLLTGLFVVLQEILHQAFFALVRLLQKVKQNAFPK